MNCQVKSIVYYEHQANDFVVEHSHHCFECVYYLEGAGKISVDKEAFSYDGPTLTFVYPGMLHDEMTEHKSKLFIVLFDVDEKIDFKPFNVYKLDEEINQKYKLLFEKMIEEEKNQQPFYQEMISLMFSTIFCEIIRNSSNKKVSANKEMVERTKTYIKENYGQNIDFEKIAFNVGYSFDRFRHIFKNETGVSIYQYLLNCRLYAAKQLLLQPNLTIKEVAKTCGFDSIVHFNNFFKAKMNISPYQFKKASLLPIDKGVFAINGTKNKPIFIDTDIGGDCDDAGALALANIFHNQGKLNIIGMTYTGSSVYGPACIDSINKFYGNSFEIGQTKRKDFCSNVNAFQKVVATEFDNDFYNPKTKKITPVIDSVKLMRKKLSEASDSSVSIVCIGQLNNASDLLDSKGDENSSLDGVELVKKKAKEFIVMGGMFPQDKETIYFEGQPYTSEYNIVTDLKSSQNFIKKCPVKVYFVDFICGYKVLTGQSLFNQNNEKNPVTISYRIFQNKPRQSWDPLAIWFATFGKSDFFSISKEGKITIDDSGHTIYHDDEKCGHYYLKLNNSVDYISNKIDLALVMEEK